MDFHGISCDAFKFSNNSVNLGDNVFVCLFLSHAKALFLFWKTWECINIPKSMSVINHIIRHKRNHTIISIHTERAFDKIPHMLMLKVRVILEQIYVGSEQAVYGSPTAKSF